MTEFTKVRRAIALWLYPPRRDYEIKTEILYFVAPKHEELAKLAAERFRANVEPMIGHGAYVFTFRSPLDRMERFVSVCAARLPLPTDGRWGLDGPGIYSDVDTICSQSSLKRKVFAAVDDVAMRLLSGETA